jgi:hypothetical protein
VHAWTEITIISMILTEFNSRCVCSQVLQYLQNVRIDSEDSSPLGFDVILMEPLFLGPENEAASSSKMPVNTVFTSQHGIIPQRT